MPQNAKAETISAAPPLLHPVRVATLDRDADRPHRVKLAPGPEAEDRIARFLGLDGLERMKMSVELRPVSDEGWEVVGQLTATVEQACVVTLEPVRSHIDVPVKRRYLPAQAMPVETDLELDVDDLDGPEPLGDVIALGDLAIETLALAIDPWPRAEGAELGEAAYTEAGLEALTDETVRPFASLAELRDRLGKRKD